MKFTVDYRKKGFADGVYKVTASGYDKAILSWANKTSALEDWICFASFALDKNGKGVFEFRGGRGIPEEASHIEVKLLRYENNIEERHLFEIPKDQKTEPLPKGIPICAMSDLHISTKTDVILYAFQQAMDADFVFLPGDLTNDGFSDEFELLKYCIESMLPHQQIFSVIGNHDMPRIPADQEDRYAAGNYDRFQKWLLNHNAILTFETCISSEKNRNDIINRDKNGILESGPDGAYAVSFGDFEVIGLQAVADPRKFIFEENRQLLWLDDRLIRTKEIPWHFILCHAPLTHHNPKRMYEPFKPYLGSDRALQSIIDNYQHIIFLTGHTHLTLNDPNGCVEWDKLHQNLYINDGTIRRTDEVKEEPLQPIEWRSGTVLQIVLTPEELEIKTVSVYSGKKHARGYYRIRKGA